jgi:hypothetical protein
MATPIRLPKGWDTGKAKGSRWQVAPKAERTMDGIVFDSKGEMNRYATLKMSERAGLISGLTRQPLYRIEVGGDLICTYKGDFFYVVSETGEAVVEDVKSSGTAKDPVFAIKKKLLKACHGIVVKVVSGK